MNDLVLEHFGLRAHPFTPEIDADGLHPFHSFSQGLARLEQALHSRSSVLVVGSPGSGKTALIRQFCKRLAPSSFEVHDRLVPAVKNPTRAIVDGFLNDFGEPIPFNNPARGLENLRKCLARLAQQNRLPVLILDDVHHLSVPAWLTLKALLNYELDSRVSVMLILVGAEDTLRTLGLNSLLEVRDRLGCCYQMRGLRSEEVMEYLHKRLTWAGNRRPLFVQDVAEQIGRESQGLPRRVNRLAAACLLAAASSHKDLVDLSCLQQAISESKFVSVNREENR